MKFTPSNFLNLGALTSILALPSVSIYDPSRFPTVNGDIVIKQYQLYPENVYYDKPSKNLLFSALYNSSIYAYNLKTGEGEAITFENITLNKKLHLSGLSKSHATGLFSFVLDTEASWRTNGKNVSGDNFLITYDLAKKTEVSRINLTETTQGKYGGFQEVVFDYAGNAYVLGTFPASILKVNISEKKVEPWYLPETINTTILGFGGAAIYGDLLLTNDNERNSLLRFNLIKPTGKPHVVPHTPKAQAILSGDADGITLLKKYDQKVMLLTRASKGVEALRTKDDWETVEYVGLIPRPGYMGDANATATVEIGGAIYTNYEYWYDPKVGPLYLAGNRTEFRLVDITEALEKLLFNA